MPQLFPRRANLISRASIIGLGLLFLILVGLATLYTHSPAITREGIPIEQPVPYSHKLHVGVLGLDCRYCHTGVEVSSFANIPPTQTCMTCHSVVATTDPNLQLVRDSYATGKAIQWNRVNLLPDFVYFNHEIHVAKGVGCETCHGRVDEMDRVSKAHPFFMAWCLECHRNPAQFIRPKEDVTMMGYQPAQDQLTLGAQLVKEYHIAPPSQLLNCSVCHR
jgi:hypothetical protein